MRPATLLLSIFAGLLTQSCKIEMPSLVQLMIRDYQPGMLHPHIYDFNQSKAIALQGRIKDTLIIGDKTNSDPKIGHGNAMRRFITQMGIPESNITFFPSLARYYVGSRNNVGLEGLVSNEHQKLREATRVIHAPILTPFDGPEDSERIASTVRGKVYVYAKRNIKEGEELVYNYGKEYFNDFIKPHGCKCLKCASSTEKN